jgi:endonuclease G
MNEDQIQYARRVLGNRSLSSLGFGALTESFGPSQSGHLEAAADALAALKTGVKLKPTHLYQLESIIVRSGRPVFDVRDDSFLDPGPAWPELETARASVEAGIRAVGRVNLGGLPSIPYAGTAFLVATAVLMTNRHVAEFFATGPGYGRLDFITGRSATLDFKQEVGTEDSIPLRVVEVLLIHPHWDCALLRVQGMDPPRTPLMLAASTPGDLAGRDVVAIGYPAFNPNPSENPALQIEIFHGVFQKKRLQPGKLIADAVPVTSFGHSVESLTHDCSTLGGNSGSAVLDLTTGQVVGLHFMGEYLVQNFSVPTWQLALDPRVVDFGVNFSTRPSTHARPTWLEAWQPYLANSPGSQTASAEAATRSAGPDLS